MNSKFKNPINLLILLGFISQGFSWENYWMPVFYAAVWFICLKIQRPKQFINKNIELLIFFLALILSIKFVGFNTYSKMLAMGNSLFVLQAMRLMWPLKRRKRILSVMMSVTLLSVGSQFIVGYSFILVLILSIILIPKSLFILESEGFQGVPPPRSFGKAKIYYPLLGLIMILFFVFFPRQKFISGKEAGMIMTEGPMRAQMDTVSGGTNLSTKPILRIKGENIEYLKGYALDTFDGNNWTASDKSALLSHFFSEKDLDMYQHRQVQVMDLTYIGSALPVDGYVINLKGNFFQAPHGLTGQENFIISLVWPQSVNNYEYWTSKKKFKPLSETEFQRYTAYPAHSPRLKNWVDSLIGSEIDPERKSELITAHLRSNFTYSTGVPDLERNAPIEDFIFNQKEGHCERYASALALLLRMSKIPSRVVVGYHVPPKNQFADYHSVLAENAHAWVEAFIKGKGWVIYDGTPASNMIQAAANPGVMFTIKDWIEYIWYSKIVEFSANDQDSIFSGTKNSMAMLFLILKKEMRWVVPLLFLIVFSLIVYNFRHWIGSFAFSKKKRVEKQLEAAERFYADLMKALAKVKIYRHSSQTPFELLDRIRTARVSYIDDIELITRNFCLVKYAEQELTPNQLKDTADAVAKIRQAVKK